MIRPITPPITAPTVRVAYSATITFIVTRTSTKNDAITHTKIVEFAKDDKLPNNPPKPTAPDTPYTVAKQTDTSSLQCWDAKSSHRLTTGVEILGSPPKIEDPRTCRLESVVTNEL